jgi:hypothetical protein
MNRAGSWIEKHLSTIRRESQLASLLDVGYSIEGLVKRLEHMRKVKERCYSHNGRCLRYWQLKAEEERRLTHHRTYVPRLQPEYFKEEEIEPLQENASQIMR